jgi:hypothetical protein
MPRLRESFPFTKIIFELFILSEFYSAPKNWKIIRSWSSPIPANPKFQIDFIFYICWLSIKLKFARIVESQDPPI